MQILIKDSFQRHDCYQFSLGASELYVTEPPANFRSGAVPLPGLLSIRDNLNKQFIPGGLSIKALEKNVVF